MANGSYINTYNQTHVHPENPNNIFTNIIVV